LRGRSLLSATPVFCMVTLLARSPKVNPGAIATDVASRNKSCSVVP
jgi:hypothetical protein